MALWVLENILDHQADKTKRLRTELGKRLERLNEENAGTVKHVMRSVPSPKILEAYEIVRATDEHMTAINKLHGEQNSNGQLQETLQMHDFVLFRDAE